MPPITNFHAKQRDFIGRVIDLAEAYWTRWRTLRDALTAVHPNWANPQVWVALGEQLRAAGFSNDEPLELVSNSSEDHTPLASQVIRELLIAGLRGEVNDLLTQISAVRSSNTIREQVVGYLQLSLPEDLLRRWRDKNLEAEIAKIEEARLQSGLPQAGFEWKELYRLAVKEGWIEKKNCRGESIASYLRKHCERVEACTEPGAPVDSPCPESIDAILKNAESAVIPWLITRRNQGSGVVSVTELRTQLETIALGSHIEIITFQLEQAGYLTRLESPPPPIVGAFDGDLLKRLTPRYIPPQRWDIMGKVLEYGQERARETQTTKPQETADDARQPAGENPSPSAAPFTPLTSWQEILSALNEPHGETTLKNDSQTRDKIRRLNADYNGPIIFPGTKGAQPSVNKAALMTWWESLRDHFDARNNEKIANEKSKRGTVADSHNYGATGKVIPGIAGSEKRSRANSEGKR